MSVVHVLCYLRADAVKQQTQQGVTESVSSSSELLKRCVLSKANTPLTWDGCFSRNYMYVGDLGQATWLQIYSAVEKGWMGKNTQDSSTNLSLIPLMYLWCCFKYAMCHSCNTSNPYKHSVVLGSIFLSPLKPLPYHSYSKVHFWTWNYFRIFKINSKPYIFRQLFDVSQFLKTLCN